MPDPQEIIRETREGKGMTQSDMAEKIASAIGGTYSLRQYQRLESGEFPKYKTDIVKTVESILNISVYDMIYDKNVPRNTQAEETESQYNAPKGVTLIDTQAGANDYLSRRQHLKNNGGAFMVPLVPVAAQAGYSKSYTNPVFINQLETFAILPGIDPHGAAWRYFEVEGDSMEDTFKEGQYLLTSQVIKEDWRNIENFYVYVIITGDKVMVKRLAKVKGKDYWACISDNAAIAAP